MAVLAAVDERVVTAIAVAAGLALFGFLLVATSAGELLGRRKAKVPPAFRPFPSDEELERRLLTRYLAWGAAATIFVAIWLPVYWMMEPGRLETKREQLQALAVEGRELSAERNGGAQLYGDFCATCHGAEAQGGVRQYTIDGKDRTYAEPPLRLIFARYKAAGRSEDEITQIIYDAINRGRPGTPMPTWGFAFGGPMNTFQVDNLVAWIRSIQIEAPTAAAGASGKELFDANCAICHNSGGKAVDDPGDSGDGGVGPNLQVALERLSRTQLHETIRNGRLNVNRPSMPAWAFLGDEAIEALVDFIESIQKGGR